MLRSLLLILITVLLFGCEKEANRKLLNGYFNYEVNGVKTEIKDEILLKENFFDCIIKGDTALSIHASKVYDGAGFILITSAGLKEGTYTLDHNLKGFYENPKDKRIYFTDETHKGTLTIKKGTFQAKTLLNTLTGTFSFEGYDATTRKSFTVTNGEFFMECKYK
jgi:hypothetical protein